MAGLFGNKEETKAQTAAQAQVIPNEVNAQTGEITSMRTVTAITVPDMKSVTKIADVAGKNPPLVNLRDHPELSGMKIIIMRASFGTGMIDGRQTEYCVAEGYIYPPSQEAPTEDQHCLIRTGSDNVYQRIAIAFMNKSFPTWGTLRAAGRAWFID